MLCQNINHGRKVGHAVAISYDCFLVTMLYHKNLESFKPWSWERRKKFIYWFWVHYTTAFLFSYRVRKSCKEVIARMKINMYRCTVLVLQHFLMTGGDTRLLKPGHMLGNCVSFVPFRNQGRVLWYCWCLNFSLFH